MSSSSAIDERIGGRRIRRGRELFADAIGEGDARDPEPESIIASHVKGPGADGDNDIGGHAQRVIASSGRIHVGFAVGKDIVAREIASAGHIHLGIVLGDVRDDCVAVGRAIENRSGIGNGAHRAGGGIDHSYGPLIDRRRRGIGFIANPGDALAPTRIVEGIGGPGRAEIAIGGNESLYQRPTAQQLGGGGLDGDAVGRVGELLGIVVGGDDGGRIGCDQAQESAAAAELKIGVQGLVGNSNIVPGGKNDQIPVRWQIGRWKGPF